MTNDKFIKNLIKVRVTKDYLLTKSGSLCGYCLSYDNTKIIVEKNRSGKDDKCSFRILNGADKHISSNTYNLVEEYFETDEKDYKFLQNRLLKDLRKEKLKDINDK